MPKITIAILQKANKELLITNNKLQELNEQQAILIKSLGSHYLAVQENLLIIFTSLKTVHEDYFEFCRIHKI